MRIVFLLIATSGFLFSALYNRDARAKFLAYWGLTTIYAVIGFVLGKL